MFIDKPLEHLNHNVQNCTVPYCALYVQYTACWLANCLTAKSKVLIGHNKTVTTTTKQSMVEILRSDRKHHPYP